MRSAGNVLAWGGRGHVAIGQKNERCKRVDAREATHECFLYASTERQRIVAPRVPRRNAATLTHAAKTRVMLTLTHPWEELRRARPQCPSEATLRRRAVARYVAA